MDSAKRKYVLTELGESELNENKYVPLMHKTKDKTTEDTKFGPVFNVWEINRRMGHEHRDDWQNIIAEARRKMDEDKAQKAMKKDSKSVSKATKIDFSSL